MPEPDKYDCASILNPVASRWISTIIAGACLLGALLADDWEAGLALAGISTAIVDGTLIRVKLGC
jgi:hypothetical protein